MHQNDGRDEEDDGRHEAVTGGGDHILNAALRDLSRPGMSCGTFIFCASLVVLFSALYIIAAATRENSQPMLALALAGLMLSLGIPAGEIYCRRQARTRIGALKTAIDTLRISRRQAEASTRAQARFLATTSHEIRTPMNGVIGMIGLLMETELTPEQRNYAKTAESSARALLSIVDELLDISKAEHDRPEIGAGPFDPVTLAESVTELLAPRAHAKGLEISCFVSHDLPPRLLGDELRIRQILFNLCGNAIKFTVAGGVALSISRDGPDYVRIEVRDTGIGMTDQETERVFEEYAQGNSDTKRLFGGTGLGLTIARQLTEAMGGTITVVSTPGKGTTFTVLLPCTAASNADPKNRMLEGVPVVLAFPVGPIAEHLRATLADLGACVQEIPDGGALRNFLFGVREDTWPDLICDAAHEEILREWAGGAPRLNGPRVFVMMRAEERRQMKDLLGPPFAGYLLKPFRRQTIEARLACSHDRTITTAVEDLRRVAAGARESAALTVLLAEDNPVNALLACTMLERAGCRVTHATNGNEVLARVKAGLKPDLIIMDVEMPALDGLKTTRHLRHDESQNGSPRVPILALTANARAEDIRECHEAGMDGHLSKPFDKQDLDEAIARLVRRRRAA